MGGESYLSLGLGRKLIRSQNINEDDFSKPANIVKKKVYQGIFISCAFSSVHDTLKYFMHFNFWHAYPAAYKLLHAVISLTSQYLKKALRKA